MKKHKNGFTLAEVLITLVIIGIIAAMTIPTLMNKTNEQETVVAVKKAYSVLSQAHQRMVAENGEINPVYYGSTAVEATQNIGDLLVKYLNVQKYCGTELGSDCFSSENGGMYKYFNGEDWLDWNGQSADSKIRLSDGSSLAFHGYGKILKVGDSEALQNIFGYINFDVNGDKGPNTCGKDVFQFWLSKYGIVPYGSPYDTNSKSNFSNCRTTGRGCSAWVITKGNMDYLRKEVSW